LCVGIGTNITMQCIIAPDPAGAKAPLPSGCIIWQFRAFDNFGRWGGWYNLGYGSPPNVYTHAQQSGGVFGIRALFFGDPDISPIYRRKNNEIFPLGSTETEITAPPDAWWRTGQPNAVGVCDTQFQIVLRNVSRGFLGSTDYANASTLPRLYGCPPSPAGVPKCNMFIAHRARSINNNSVPLISRGPFKRSNPPLAEEWSRANFSPLAAWRDSSNLQPGCVVTGGGHMGITDYDGRRINAGTYNVNKGYRVEGGFLKRYMP